MAVYDLEELDRQELVEKSAGAIEAEKQCKIHLAATYHQAIKLEWHGGKGHRLAIIVLEPGKTVVQPLAKTQAWFGPFSVPMEYAATTDERRRDKLKQFWAEEKTRYLSRYDYPRPTSMTKEGYEPTGHHRSPDVTITIIESDGEENPPIRLYELYKIGPWDPIADVLDKKAESAAQVEMRLKNELATVSERYERQLEEQNLRYAELKGMVLASNAKAKV